MAIGVGSPVRVLNVGLKHVTIIVGLHPSAFIPELIVESLERNALIIGIVLGPDKTWSEEEGQNGEKRENFKKRFHKAYPVCVFKESYYLDALT